MNRWCWLLAVTIFLLASASLWWLIRPKEIGWTTKLGDPQPSPYGEMLEVLYEHPLQGGRTVGRMAFFASGQTLFTQEGKIMVIEKRCLFLGGHFAFGERVAFATTKEDP